jgi:hypothetical protein
LFADNTKIPEYHVNKSEQQHPKGKVLNNRVLRIKLVREFLKKEAFFTPHDAREAGIVDKVLLAGDSVLDGMFEPSGKA